VDIDKGTLGEDFGGRRWKVEVVSAQHARDQAKGQAQAKRDEKKRHEDLKEGEKILQELRRHHGQ
jgi:hypothetical protein